MKLHPSTQIIIWCALVAAMQFMMPHTLLIVTALVLSSAFYCSRRKFYKLLRRTRWILIMLWAIYAFSTPGEPLLETMGLWSPTVEGLQEGALQLIRLLAALAGLAILLDRLHDRQLMAGLYSLFFPLCWLGISRVRLAVRLALTLHYAEVAMLKTESWQDSLRSLNGQAEDEVGKAAYIELPRFDFSQADALMMAAVAMLLWVLVK